MVTAWQIGGPPTASSMYPAREPMLTPCRQCIGRLECARNRSHPPFAFSEIVFELSSHISIRNNQKEDRARKRCGRAGIVRCLVYWWTKHWAWFEKRREEKSPKRGWMFGERMSPSWKVSGSSRPGIPAERDIQTIWDLHVAIKRGNPLKRGNKRWWGSPRQWCTWSSRRLLVQECAGASCSEMMTYIFTFESKIPFGCLT